MDSFRRLSKNHTILLIFILSILFAFINNIEIKNVYADQLRTNHMTLNAIPNDGFPGATIAISGTQWQPGGPANILWDDTVIKTINIPADGNFSESFTIPSNASPGSHILWVCLGNPCPEGEFSQKKGKFIYVLINEESTEVVLQKTTQVPTDTPVPQVGLVDYQILAIEVTQGVRGDIPFRTTPNGILNLEDDVIHISNRRTIVRVYPFVNLAEGGFSSPVTATLKVINSDGSISDTILPVIRFLVPEPGKSLEEMRSNSMLSWNFVLPNEFIKDGTVRLEATINPFGSSNVLECLLCQLNNEVSLRNVQFATLQDQYIEMRFILADLSYYDDSGSVINFPPSLTNIATALNYWIKVIPIDPNLLDISYYYYRLSQNPPPYKSESNPDANPREVSPEIPGFPLWDNEVFNDDHKDIIFPKVLKRSPYVFLPAIFNQLSYIGCDGRAGVGWTPLFMSGDCGPTFAQESMHSITRNHAANSHGEAGGGPVDPNFPGLHGQVENNAYGFDIYKILAIPPVSDSGDHTHDYMSYGVGIIWTSIYSWEGITDYYKNFVEINAEDTNLNEPQLINYTVSSNDQSNQEFIRISGNINNNGSISLNPIFNLNLTGHVDDLNEFGSYSFVLEDRSGDIIYEKYFIPSENTHGNLMSFYEVAPRVNNLAKIKFFKDGNKIGEIAVSDNPPILNLIKPVSGDRLDGEGTILVKWEGSDPDSNELLYKVQASSDGIKWHTIYGLTDKTEVMVNLADIPGGGSDWRIRVQATDWVNVTVSEIDKLYFATKPPIPIIINPLNNEFFQIGGSIDLIGQAFDYQDGKIEDKKLEWFLNGESKGFGVTNVISDLEEGEHVLKLKATNEHGQIGEMTINIIVGEDSDFDGLPNNWEINNGFDANNPADAAGDPDDDGIPNWLEFQRDTNPNEPDDNAENSDHSYLNQVGEILNIDNNTENNIAEENIELSTEIEQNTRRLPKYIFTSLIVIFGILIVFGLYLIIKGINLKQR